MKFIPHEYQKKAIAKGLENERYALFMEMGLGKSVSALTIFNTLKYDHLETDAMIIVAPLRVALLTWRQEAAKWDHLKHLRVTVLHGDNKDIDIHKRSDVYIINYDGLAWLKKKLKGKVGRSFISRLGLVVFDESTMAKTPRASRAKISRMLSIAIPRAIILTGTPTPNNLLDIWNQIYLLDQGERLGETYGAFKSRYFAPTGYMGYSLKPVRGAKDRVTEKISDISLTMKAEDYLDMPDKIDNKIHVQLDDSLMERYKTFEREFMLELESADIVAFNAAALTAKLRQFVQGFVYDTETNKPHIIHTEKIKALREIYEGSASPILVAIQYRYEAEMIKKEFGANTPIIFGGTKTKDTISFVDRWNKGRSPILVAHPASLAHGVNLQSGGATIVWLGIPYNLEHYLQFNARLYRQGQEKTCVVHHVIAKGTIDEVVYRAVRSKETSMDYIMKKLKEYGRR